MQLASLVVSKKISFPQKLSPLISQRLEPNEENKRRPSHLLSLVPDIWVPQELLWSGGQVEFEGEAEDVVHSAQEVQAALDLPLNLGNKKKIHLFREET